MKKLISYLSVFLLMLATCTTLYSCLDLDDDNDNNTAFSIGTIKIIQGRDYYFALDSGEKMYPSDTTRVHNYPLVDGQRVFIYFRPLDQKISGYDYNVQLYQLNNILTKNIIPLTAATADSIGDDRINATNMWITDRFLNIEYQIYSSDNPTKKHMLNLVINKTKGNSSDNADYIDLELRHNAFNDSGILLSWGVVSFRLDEIANQLPGKKGLKVRFNSIYDGERFTTVKITDK